MFRVPGTATTARLLSPCPDSYILPVDQILQGFYWAQGSGSRVATLSKTAEVVSLTYSPEHLHCCSLQVWRAHWRHFGDWVMGSATPFAMEFLHWGFHSQESMALGSKLRPYILYRSFQMSRKASRFLILVIIAPFIVLL